MKRYCLLFVVVCCIHPLKGQGIISNKLNVQVSYSITSPIGSATIEREQYKSPSLINNFQSSKSLGIGMSYRLNSILSARFEISQSMFDAWTVENSTRFDEAQYKMLAVSPQVEVSTPFRESGSLNRITLFARLGPDLGIHTAKLARSAFSDAGSSGFDFNKSSFFAPGINFSTGLNVALDNKLVAGISYGVKSYWVSSILFDDSRATFGSLSLHLGFRFLNNKRYKYRI